MTRGTFANVRLRNQLAPGTEGGFTRYLPSGEQMTIYDAAQSYRADGTPMGSVTESVQVGATDMAQIFSVQFDSAEAVGGYGYELSIG